MNKSDWDILARRGVTPENAVALKWLNCSHTGITALPDMPALRELYCYNTGVTALPDMPALEALNCSHTGITALPDMPALKWLYCFGTDLSLFDDPRGYSLARLGDMYFAGCRRFPAAEAIAHWGAPNYPDPKRGAKYVAAVKAEEARRAKA